MSSGDLPRYCRCGARLATDNTGSQCALCSKLNRDRLLVPPPLPTEFWLTPQMRDAFADQHIGRVARAYRRHPHHAAGYGAAGISQALLGQWLGLTQAQVSRIEGGPPVRNIDSLTHWARVLGIPAGLLWFDLPGSRRPHALFDGCPAVDLRGGDWTETDSHELATLLCEDTTTPVGAESVSHLVHTWLVTEPPQVVQRSGGRRIGENLVRAVEHRTAELRRIDDFVAGGDLHALVVRELRATAALLREASYGETLGRRLLAATGELAQLAGWVLGDAGRYAAAARHYLLGVRAAHAAGDTVLAANLVSTLAYQVSNVGNPRHAVLLAQSADTGARSRTTPKVRALLGERLAWAHARAGERRQAERALAAVETAYDSGSSTDDPEWGYWLDEDEISIMAGRCYVELGEAERAVRLLAGVLDTYDQRRTRELALYTSWLAEAHLQLGAIDEATAAATRTHDLTSRTTSARTDDRLTALRRKLRPFGADPLVIEFEQRVRDSTRG
jgi:tetratricopeptide (TPR) repeat protein